MSHEFAPQTQTPAEDMTIKKIIALDVNLEGDFRVKHDIATSIYEKAIPLAENIDDREETSVPFRSNAIVAAALLASACVRGAQIS